MKSYEAGARALADLGVRTVFGLAGDGNLFVLDAFMRQDGCSYVPVTHEAASVAMASGYARAAGGVGVASVTHGPGVTNALTALVGAVKLRTPLLLLAGDTNRAVWGYSQFVPQRELVTTIGAGFEQVRRPSTIADDIRRAYKRTLDERRPIVVNMPIEFMHDEVDEPRPTRPILAHQPTAPDEEVLDAAVGAIANAARPLIIAGRGAVEAGARKPLIALAERLGAPLSTTLLAKDFFRGHPDNLGIFGTLSVPSTLAVIADADCIVAFGASLNMRTTYSGSMVEGKRVIQCDIDPSRLGEHQPVDVALVGDAGRTAKTIGEWLATAEVDRSRAWAVPDPSLDTHFEEISTGLAPGTVSLSEALDCINRHLPADRIVGLDVGRCMRVAMQVLEVPEPNAFTYSGGFGAVGTGLATAIGAGIARPGRPVLAIVGDGGFMMAGTSELYTAVREGVDLVVAILNDGGYGAEHIQFTNRGMDPSLALFDWPDFAALAEPLGFTGVTVTSQDDLDALGPALAARTGPMVIDVHIDPYKIPAPVR